MYSPKPQNPLVMLSYLKMSTNITDVQDELEMEGQLNARILTLETEIIKLQDDHQEAIDRLEEADE